MEGPIILYESKEQLNENLKYWKDKLFLNDWIISVNLTKEPLESENHEELWGRNTFDIVDKSSWIEIVIPTEEDLRDSFSKYCAEKVLVHELLHCKMNFMDPPKTFEGKFYDTFDHALLEQTAKSLIMVKYNLPFSWFYVDE